MVAVRGRTGQPETAWGESPWAHDYHNDEQLRALQSLRLPGRKKFGTIMKAAMRLLHSLKPKSVNRSGGSHTVFHFPSGAPVTLVTPHAGRSKDGTKSGSYCTRLYATLHEVALQRFHAVPLSQTTSQPALTAARKNAAAEIMPFHPAP